MNGYGPIPCYCCGRRASTTSPNDRFAEPVANYAYLRVSTHTQDVENQKLSVLDYCNSQGIAPIEFVEDTTSGRRSWRDREIGRLLETADAGDVLVAAEVSRLARSTLGARPIVAGHDNRNDPWARGADRAGIYLGQDERGA